MNEMHKMAPPMNDAAESMRSLSRIMGATAGAIAAMSVSERAILERGRRADDRPTRSSYGGGKRSRYKTRPKKHR